jgi:hypothetical protein
MGATVKRDAAIPQLQRSDSTAIPNQLRSDGDPMTQQNSAIVAIAQRSRTYSEVIATAKQLRSDTAAIAQSLQNRFTIAAESL